eukprot:TRINITY_DN21601_c0_g1_i1.p1 TRINITY_DN21601_c0_g1~~TRINITY_DN21601_c0_g1_i1.p1  ORF type:complete len:1211 (-),score=404.54 TRINITY_DN21601_c0_g1_i1:179-3394(-)
MEDNLEGLLRLARHDSGKDMKKSAVRGYALELIMLTVKLREEASYLKRFSSQLLQLVKCDESSRLYELFSWLGPLEDLSRSSTREEDQESGSAEERGTQLTDDDEIAISRLCESVRKSMEPFSVSPSLISSLRLLSLYLDAAQESSQELHKTKYHLVIAFSKDLYEHFLSVLSRVNGLYEHPSCRVGSLSSFRHGSLLVSLLLPLLRALSHLLRFVIQSRGVEFQDLRPIVGLLRTYALSLSFPIGSFAHASGQSIRSLVLSSILSFTSPPFDPAKHNMADSLWKKTVKEIMDFSISAPQHYVPGLRVLSEILPLPLPIMCATALDSLDSQSAIHLRKLWSGHLFPLEASLSELVAMMSACVSPKLLRLLKRVLIQISDLSYHSSTMVSRALLDSLRKNEEDSPSLRCSLAFLADILDNGAIKSSFLSLTLEDSFIYDTLQKALSTPGFQFPVFKILNRLLDPSHRVSPSAGSPVNGLPSKAQVNVGLVMCMDYLSSSSPQETHLQLILGAFQRLSENEFGFRSLRTAFFRSPPAMKTIFQVLSEKYNAKAVRTWLDTLKNLTSGPNHLSSQELGHLLQWEQGEGNPHPIRSLKATLLGQGPKVEGLAEELDSHLGRLLEGGGAASTETGDIKLSLSLLCDNDNSFPAPEPLSNQFEARDIWTLTSNHVREEEGAGESPPPPGGVVLFQDFILEEQEEYTKDEDLGIEVDLFAFAETCLPKDFELSKELDNLNDDFETLSKKRKTIGGPLHKAKSLLLESKQHPKSSNLKASSLLPSRQNNGSNNARFNRGGQRLDAFRSRPPNTSRPPSLHVDDFLVLQSLGQQPTGPTGYNKQSVKAAKELFAQREAAQGKSSGGSLVGFREATDKPVYSESQQQRGSSNNSSNNNGGSNSTNPSANSSVNNNNNNTTNGLSNSSLTAPSSNNDSRRPNRSAQRLRPERSERNRSSGVRNYRNSGGGGNSSNTNSNNNNDRGIPRERSNNASSTNNNNSNARYSPRYSPLPPPRDYRGPPDEEARRFSNGSRSRNPGGNWSDRAPRTKERFSARSRNGSRGREHDNSSSRQRHMRPLAR